LNSSRNIALWANDERWIVLLDSGRDDDGWRTTRLIVLQRFLGRFGFCGIFCELLSHPANWPNNEVNRPADRPPDRGIKRMLLKANAYGALQSEHHGYQGGRTITRGSGGEPN